jgi:hypothetical protein
VKHKRQTRLMNEGVKRANRTVAGAISITTNYIVFLPRFICNQDAVFDVEWCVMRLEYFRYVSDI